MPRSANAFCVGTARSCLAASFPVATSYLYGACLGVGDSACSRNSSCLLLFDVTTNVVRDLFRLHFLDRTANRVVDRSLLHFLDRASNRIVDGLGVIFGDGTSNRIITRFVSGFPDRASYRVGFVTVTSLSNRSANGDLNSLPYGFVAITITRFLTRVVNNSTASTHDCVATASGVRCNFIGCNRINRAGRGVACAPTTALRHAEAG